MTVDAARPARPAQVTVAFWFQLAAVALLLGLVGLVVAYAVHFDDEISRAAALVPDADPAEVSSERSGNVFTSLILGVPTLLLAVWLAATAVPVSRGSNIARILVFVAGGGQLLICLLQGCGGFLVAPFFFAFDSADVSGTDVSGTGEVPWEESKFLETLYSDVDPFSEVSFLAGGAGALVVLMLTCVVVLLLALPPAHRYFVPRTAAPQAPGWPAVHPGAGYPLPVPYMVCPDPSVHFPPVAASPVTAPPPEPTSAPPTTTNDA
ncbi:hypothetical protein ACFFX1_14690 [Dactylosporangium sucinum]|uniref:Uncharacterized protein n=1 Tax=Dactylosporangium sucinum TaxID=1424081 RepID=A0A917UBK2_9ACTN|nr:hypothetical protein [Dactylosporangium sucinum]GGM69373.1 hypothetical protein GCM10007977_083880 [Dactylosporangium sucinum]